MCTKLGTSSWVNGLFSLSLAALLNVWVLLVKVLEDGGRSIRIALCSLIMHAGIVNRGLGDGGEFCPIKSI